MQAVNGFLAKAGGKDKLTALIQVILAQARFHVLLISGTWHEDAQHLVYYSNAVLLRCSIPACSSQQGSLAMPRRFRLQ